MDKWSDFRGARRRKVRVSSRPRESTLRPAMLVLSTISSSSRSGFMVTSCGKMSRALGVLCQVTGVGVTPTPLTLYIGAQHPESKLSKAFSLCHTSPTSICSRKERQAVRSTRTLRLSTLSLRAIVKILDLKTSMLSLYEEGSIEVAISSMSREVWGS